jgi:hypothetical protein
MAVSLASPKRIAALLVVALMVVAPLAWIVWSLAAATTIATANRDQAEMLASLQTRLKALTASAKGAKADEVSVYLPGKSPAIAGAALQRIVANTVQAAGGRVVQSEIARPEATAAEPEPGVINLRTEFETDIVGVQRVIFDLETGAPILTVQALTIEASQSAADSANPGLSVVLLVRGRWET